MGSDLIGAGSSFERLLSTAEHLTGEPLRRYCLEGPLIELRRTEIAQPVIMAHSIALAEAAIGAGLRPDLVAGHSLGEYSAAVVAGSLSPDDGIRLACERGRLMAAVQRSSPGTMAAVMGLPADRVLEICTECAGTGLVVVANLNGAGQVVVSGEMAAVEAAMKAAVGAGAEQVTRLPVGAAFHSPLMSSIREDMGQLVAELGLVDPKPPLVANHSGQVVTTGAELAHALLQQITSPVLWESCVQALVRAGCTTMLELGPGRVLTGLAHVTVPDLEAVAVDSLEKLSRYLDGRSASGRLN